jgi:hypothetical protein
MADPRGVNGALVPLSEARADEGDAAGSAAPAAPDRRAGQPLFSPEAASRLFTGRLPLTEAGQAAATAAAALPIRPCAASQSASSWTGATTVRSTAVRRTRGPRPIKPASPARIQSRPDLADDPQRLAARRGDIGLSRPDRQRLGAARAPVYPFGPSSERCAARAAVRF